ncbi:hypothetical protein FZEAL_5668, partial [Fusarium zealandicum]
MKAEYTANIIILGAPSSGKKSYIRRYCTEVFTDRYDPITETYSDQRLALISGIPTTVNLERIPSTFIRSSPEASRIASEADALILLYDGSSAAGLEELRRMRLDVLAPYLEDAPPTAVVASMADVAGEKWEEGMG